TAKTPVMFLSPDDGEESQARAWEAGADDIVIEPFSARELLGRIKARLALAQAHDEALAHEQALRGAAEVLNKVATELTSELDLQALVQKMTDAGTTLTGAKFGAFFFNSVGDDGEMYLLYALSGAPHEAFEDFGLPRVTPLFAPTFRGEGVVRVADLALDPRYGQNLPHHGLPLGHLPVRSYLALPVKSRSGEILGGLFFGHP